MLPASGKYQPLAASHPHGNSFATAAQEIANFFTTGVKRALQSFTSSLTALGSRTNAMFATITAALALDRAARDTASSFGYGNAYNYAPISQAQPTMPFWPWGWPAAPAMAPFQPMAMLNPGFAGSIWDNTPWNAFSQGFAAFFGAAQPRNVYGFAPPAAPPQTVAFSVPGLLWGFPWNPQTSMV